MAYSTVLYPDRRRAVRILFGAMGVVLVLAAAAIIYTRLRNGSAPSRPVREAISSGRILVSSAEEFDRHFIRLPAHEARDLLVASRSAGEARMLFPAFSIGSEPRFEVIETSSGALRELVLRGLPEGTRFYGFFDGSLVFSDRATSIAFADGLGRDFEEFLYTIRLVRALDVAGTPLGPYGVFSPVAIGSVIGILDSFRTLDLPGVPLGSQAVFALKRGEDDVSGASLSNLVLKDGRIVFVATPPL